MNKMNKETNISKIIDLLLKDSFNICKNLDMKMLQDKKIIITGASGLLGINFLASLLYLKITENLNANVVAITSERPQEQWFYDLINLGDFTHVRGDLSNIDFVKSLTNADYVIHGATYSSPSEFTKDKVKTITLNTTTTNELIQKLNNNGKFLFISTSEIYNGNPKTKYEEGDIGMTSTDNPRSCYIEGKRCGEAICNAYCSTNNENIKIARVCLAYGIGVRLDDSRALNSFIKKGLDGEISLLDSGEAQRTYLYVSDAIEMLWNILLHGKQRIYNVGGKSSTTIKDLASDIANKLNVELKLPEEEKPLIGSPNSVSLCMDKIEKEFDKSKYVDLQDGLSKVIEWYKELIIIKNKKE